MGSNTFDDLHNKLNNTAFLTRKVHKIELYLCRLCLDTRVELESIYNNYQKTTRLEDTIKTTFPDMMLGLTKSPLVCRKCLNTLNTFQEFKTQVMANEVFLLEAYKKYNISSFFKENDASETPLKFHDFLKCIEEYKMKNKKRSEVFKRGKTNAEMCKNYYNRKKAAKEAEKIRQGSSVKKPIKKTGAERTRACRLRKKMLSQVNDSSVTEISSIPSTSNSPIRTFDQSFQLATTSASTNRPDVSTVSSADVADHDENRNETNDVNTTNPPSPTLSTGTVSNIVLNPLAAKLISEGTQKSNNSTATGSNKVRIKIVSKKGNINNLKRKCPNAEDENKPVKIKKPMLSLNGYFIPLNLPDAFTNIKQEPTEIIELDNDDDSRNSDPQERIPEPSIEIAKEETVVTSEENSADSSRTESVKSLNIDFDQLEQKNVIDLINDIPEIEDADDMPDYVQINNYNYDQLKVIQGPRTTTETKDEAATKSKPIEPDPVFKYNLKKSFEEIFPTKAKAVAEIPKESFQDVSPKKAKTVAEILKSKSIMKRVQMQNRHKLKTVPIFKELNAIQKRHMKESVQVMCMPSLNTEENRNYIPKTTQNYIIEDRRDKEQQEEEVTKRSFEQLAPKLPPSLVEKNKAGFEFLNKLKMSQGAVFQKPKTNPEKCKTYYNRKKYKTKKKCSAKTNAELCRAYRLRKKLAQGYQSPQPVITDSSLSTTAHDCVTVHMENSGPPPQPMITGTSTEEVAKKAPSPKKRSTLPVPLRVLRQFSRSHLCLTNLQYSDDGYYLEDHDYLVSPYRCTGLSSRNQYNNAMLLKCLLCNKGYMPNQFEKHMVARHRPHGNTFRCCFRDFNLYSFNEHLFQHSCYCKVCKKSVVWPAEAVSYKALIKLGLTYDHHNTIESSEEYEKIQNEESPVSEKVTIKTENLYTCEICFISFESQTELDDHRSNCNLPVSIDDIKIEETTLQEPSDDNDFYLDDFEEEDFWHDSSSKDSTDL